MTAIQASLEKNQRYVYNNLSDKRKKAKPKFQVNNLVSIADLKKTFSQSDFTNWSYKLYKTTEINNDTVPSYKTNCLPEKCIGALLKKTELTVKENESVTKN